MANGRATKIFMPSDIASVVASLGVAGEALGIGDATAVDKTPAPKPEPRLDPCVDEDTSQGGKDAAATSERINREIAMHGRRGADHDDVN